MPRALRIHIAGAGALGLACAVRLAQAGADVTVFDPAPFATNASGVAAGMLAPAFECVLDEAARPHLPLLLEARDLWPAFADALGLDLDRRGAMAVGDESRLAGLEAAFSELGLDCERTSAAQATELAPGLAPAFASGLFTREDWRIEAAATLEALRGAARSAGAAFRPAALDVAEEADLRVIATGAAKDLAGLVPELDQLTPIKGHILRLPMIAYDGVVVRGPGGYAAPAEGGMTVGATMEAGLDDLTVDPARVEALAAAGRAMFPALAGHAPRAVVGVRAATPDGLPLVGPSVTPRTILAAGARRNGWLLAPLASRIVSAYAFGSDPGPWAAGLEPRRFAPR